MYKLKNSGGGDKDKVHLRKKSIKEGMVKHSFSGCEGESTKYHRKKTHGNYKSISINMGSNNNNNSLSNNNYYYGMAKYIPPVQAASQIITANPSQNHSVDAINSQYHQHYYH